MIDPSLFPARSAPAVVPMFGVAPHTPGKSAEAVARVKRRQPCPTCGPGPGRGSSFVCMDCHRGSVGMERAAARHALPASADRMKAPEKPAKAPKPKPKPKGKPGRKPMTGLTAKQRKALRREARKGEHDLPIVAAFLASQPA